MFIKKPEEISIVHGTTLKEPLSLEWFLKYIVETCEQFNTSAAGLRAGMRIENAAERDKDRNVVEISAEDLALAVDAAAKPTRGYPALRGAASDGRTIEVPIGRECLRFVEALEGASAEAPSPTATETTETT